jgi:VWFA-related protein
MRRRVLAAIVLAILAEGGGAAQTPSGNQPPVFTAGVEIVRLDVTATDEDGRPLRNLSRDEINVVEDGEVRPVVFFQHIVEPSEPYAENAKHTIAGEVSTNQGSAHGHLYVFVFDQQHIVPGNEEKARAAAQRFLRTRVRPGDRVALYSLPGPGPQSGFTSDAAHIARELMKVRGMALKQEAGPLGSMTIHEAVQIVRGSEETISRVAGRIETESMSDTARAKFGSVDDESAFRRTVKEDARTLIEKTDNETRRVLGMLADALGSLRPVEGRKSVVLFSEGFYGEHVTREVEDVAAAAAQSYSVVYAIDLNQREPDMTADVPVGADQYTGILDRVDPLGSLAVETGGRLITDATHRADEALRALADESQDYYLVGFTPRDAALKDRGRYRRVSVTTSRPGVRMSTRTGFALPSDDAKIDRRQAIDRALSAPFPQQGLPVEYTTYVLRGSPGMQRVVLSLITQLPLASARQAKAADVVFAVRSALDGRIVASGTDTIALPSRPAAGQTTASGMFRVQFELPAGEYIMRAVVREPDGLVGSADRRFTVRRLDGPGPAAGDLVLSDPQGELPVRPIAYAADGLGGTFEVYGRSAEQLNGASVVFELDAPGESGAVLSESGILEEVRPSGSGVVRTARLAMPLQGVAPGTYVARAVVKSAGDTIAEAVRDVEVRAGSSPQPGQDAPEPFDPKEIVNGALAREYRARITATGSSAAVHALRGLERFGAGDFAAAIAAFQAALAADTGNGATSFFLGWAYHAAGDDREAISSWRRAAFVDPTLVPAHLALAELYVQLSQPALARQALNAGLAAIPDSPELRDRLARLDARR